MTLRTEARMGESVVHGYAEMAGHHLTKPPHTCCPPSLSTPVLWEEAEPGWIFTCTKRHRRGGLILRCL